MMISCKILPNSSCLSVTLCFRVFIMPMASCNLTKMPVCLLNVFAA
jgi:hypothetical protein